MSSFWGCALFSPLSLLLLTYCYYIYVPSLSTANLSRCLCSRRLNHKLLYCHRSRLPDYISTLTTARDAKNGLRPPERLVLHQPRDEDAFGAHGVRWRKPQHCSLQQETFPQRRRSHAPQCIGKVGQPLSWHKSCTTRGDGSNVREEAPHWGRRGYSSFSKGRRPRPRASQIRSGSGSDRHGVGRTAKGIRQSLVPTEAHVYGHCAVLDLCRRSRNGSVALSCHRAPTS